MAHYPVCTMVDKDVRKNRGTDDGIWVRLTQAQVDTVRRADSGATRPSLALLLSDLASREPSSPSAVEDMYRDEFAERDLSHSLFRGLLVLAAFASQESELGVDDVSRQVGMHKSTTHRYMKTLVAFGILVQEPTTRTYRLAI